MTAENDNLDANAGHAWLGLGTTVGMATFFGRSSDITMDVARISTTTPSETSVSSFQG